MDYRGHHDQRSILPQADHLKQFVKKITGALFPGSCLLCAADSGHQLLCAACTRDLPTLPPYCCPLCADQTTHGERCGSCLKDAPHFDRTIALFPYDFPVDRMIHALKYGHQLAVADWCGARLAEKLGESRFDRLIPLPLHPDRLRQRGFNQSAEIARVCGNCRKIPVDRDNLKRIRATPPQADLPHKERQRNVRSAFECSADFSGQRLLLIDDVLTTGATANECARILKLHGAASVTVAVIARALKH